MKKITLQEFCELRLFMIADGYTSEQIKDELSKYTVIELGGTPILNNKAEIVGI